jgi:hypothetical protein
LRNVTISVFSQLALRIVPFSFVLEACPQLALRIVWPTMRSEVIDHIAVEKPMISHLNMRGHDKDFI